MVCDSNKIIKIKPSRVLGDKMFKISKTNAHNGLTVRQVDLNRILDKIDGGLGLLNVM